jgi:hypothetical protein
MSGTLAIPLGKGIDIEDRENHPSSGEMAGDTTRVGECKGSRAWCPPRGSVVPLVLSAARIAAMK